MSGKGKRYETEGTLNYKKVFAAILAILVVIMFFLALNKILNTDANKTGNKSYFALYSENKWGVIDEKGVKVIEPSYQEMIIVPNSSKDVFLCVYDVNYSESTYKTKALNSNNEEIFTEYSNIEAIQNYDSNNNLWYIKEALKVQKDGKYGLIDLSGKEILACEYDEIYALNGINNSIIVKKDGKLGLVDVNGKKKIDTEYAEILPLGEKYESGYIVKNSENLYGIIDQFGNKVLENKYSDIEQVSGDDMYVVKENEVTKVINKEGTTILESVFDRITQISSNKIAIVKDGKYGLINTNGETVIPNAYDDLKIVSSEIFIAKNGTYYGIINAQNETQLSFSYTKITYKEKSGLYLAENEDYTTAIVNGEFKVVLSGILSEYNEDKGYIRIRTENDYKYYNLKLEEKTNIELLKSNTLFLSKKDGKYGFVDKNGNVVVDYTYDDATEQNEFGFAAIKLNGKWGAIDPEGNIVKYTVCNLDNNYKIDFISNWHLGVDLNMNYYCDI